MNLVFTDEQYAEVEGNKFALIIGFSISSDQFVVFRRQIYERLANILGLVDKANGGKRIKDPPLLHGCDFLREYDDAKKLEALSSVFDLLKNTECSFYRVGYFLASSPGQMDTRGKQKFCLDASLHGLWKTLWSGQVPSSAIISEFDKEDLRKYFSSMIDKIGVYYQIGDGSLSVPLDKMIGHFFAKKGELGCQIADLVAYVAYKSMSRGSDFHNSIGNEFSKISGKFAVDQIIWWNDNSRSIIRV